MKPAPPLVGLYNGPSRMRGNSHVRFLGEGAAATPLSYPTRTGQVFRHTGLMKHGQPIVHFNVKKVKSPIIIFTHFPHVSYCATHCNNRGGKSVMLVPYEK